MFEGITELDKLKCAEYVLDLLESKLGTDDHGTVYPSERGVWIQRCKDECIMRRGQYLNSYARIGS